MNNIDAMPDKGALSQAACFMSVAGSVALFVAAGLYGCTLWLGEFDSFEIYRNISVIAHDGVYARSRSFGFPFYEIPASLIAYRYGITVANLYSFANASLFLLAFYFIIRKTPSFYLVFPAMALSPITLAASSSLIETTQGWMFYGAALLAGKRAHDSPGSVFLPISLVMLYFAAMTRVDYALPAFAMMIALVARKDMDWKRIAGIAAGFVVCGACVATTYYLLNGGFAGIAEDMRKIAMRDSFAVKLIKAAVGFVTLFTPAGIIALAAVGWSARRGITKSLRDFRGSSFYVKTFIALAPLNVAAYVNHSFKLEYLAPAYILFLVLLSHSVGAGRCLAGVMSAIIITANVFSVSFLKKEDYRAPRPTLSIGIGEGAIFQEFDRRRAIKLKHDQRDGFRQRLGETVRSLGCETFVMLEDNTREETVEADCLVAPKAIFSVIEMMYPADKLRVKKLVACSYPFDQLPTWWRMSRRYEDYFGVHRDFINGDLDCEAWARD